MLYKLRPLRLLFTALAAGFLTASIAQTPATSSQQRLTVNSTLVYVPALVRDRTGEPVYNLTADDFTLTDDGVPQKITLQPDNGDAPIAIVVLVECGAAQAAAGWHPASRGEPENRLHALPAFVQQIIGNVPHHVAVVGFDSSPTLLQGFTSNEHAVNDAIDDFTAQNDGDDGAAILDSIGFAVDLLRSQPPGYRRAILLISETNDSGSKLPLADALRAITNTNTTIFSATYSTGKSRTSQYAHRMLPTKSTQTKRNTSLSDHVYAEATPPESPAEAVLHAMMTLVTLENAEPNPAGGCISKQSDPGASAGSHAYDCVAQLLPPLALARMAAIAATDGLHRNIPETIAKLTGGESFTFNNERSLEQALVAMSNHLPNRYALSFQPQMPHAGPHALQLMIPGNKALNIQARTAYWADPADAK